MRQLALENLAPVKSIEDFVDRISEIKKQHTPTVWYRGQSKNTYRLIPSIGRPHEYNGKTIEFTKEQERSLLHRFRRRIYPLMGSVLNEWEAILLARHHLLPTRLLDWSRLPLIALYFAVSANQKVAGDVWAIVRFASEEHDLDVLEKSVGGPNDGPLCLLDPPKNLSPNCTQDAVKIIHPFYNSPRIVSQDGVFTLHHNPSHPLDEYAGQSFDDERLDVEYLIRIPIPANAKQKLVWELDTFGINRRTVFPDLDGIAQHLWEIETMWKGKAIP